ncbi:hypothetical protein [Paraburkholderia antibiotica]|uniref:Uncharacterized protein n=1 Tax=Paraburkholderia antibiotica TaxID=2728839 RepID=A0A7Y0A1R0_9BURK|nr:hypothetical protein [Paraburkholderia antibiotica]NML34902.1 hypothetical protein [Paraburkholderia antibiotica]
MKPFDLDAAKRGEPIQARIDGEWNNVKFVGLGWADAVIVDHVSLGMLRYSGDLSDWLRMAPKKRTVYVNLYPEHATIIAGGYRAVWHDTLHEAQFRSLIGALAVAVPIEIEE